MRRWGLGCLLTVLVVPSLLCAGLFFWWARPIWWTVEDIPVSRQGQVVWKASLMDAHQGRAWLRAMLMEEAWWGPVDVWVAGWPADFRLPLPSEVQVIGALRTRHPLSETRTQIWLTFPAEEAVLQEFLRVLRKRGWREPWWARWIYRLEARRPTPRGFVSSPEGGATPLTRFYCGEEGRFMQLRLARPSEEASVEATLVLVRTDEARALPAQPPCTWKAAWRMLSGLAQAIWGSLDALPGVVRVPELPPPAGVHQAARSFGTWERQGYLAYVWLWRETGEPLDVTQVMEHYAALLHEQGWRFEDQEALGNGLRMRWTRRSLLGRTWVLQLTAVSMDGGRVTAWMSLAPQGQDWAWVWQRVSEPKAMEVRIHGPVSPKGVQAVLKRWWQEKSGPQSRVTVYPGDTAPPLPFPRPQGVWLLGAVERQWHVMGVERQQHWWLYTERGEAEVRDVLTQTLKAQGWVQMPPYGIEGGFVLPRQQRARRWNLGRWCHEQQPMMLEIALRPDGEQGWWIWVRRLPFPSLASCKRLEMEAGALPGPWAWIPGLELPDGIPVVPGVPLGAPLPMGSVWIRTRDRAQVLTTLHEQLKKRGWQPEDQGAGGGVIWSLWTWPEEGKTRRFYLVAWEVTPEYTLILLTFGPAFSDVGSSSGE